MNKLMKILVVDDDGQVFMAIKQHIDLYMVDNPNLQAELKVIHAEDAPVALFKMQNESFKLMIIDNFLPKVEGLKLIELLKKGEKTKRIPIIFISGMFESPHVKEAIALGIKHILTKPFTGEKLMETIKLALKPMQI